MIKPEGDYVDGMSRDIRNHLESWVWVFSAVQQVADLQDPSDVRWPLYQICADVLRTLVEAAGIGADEWNPVAERLNRERELIARLSMDA
jgi:hypothetical protein